MGCLRCRIHASLVEAVLLMISKKAATQFSLMISDPIGAVCGVKSMIRPWTQFR